MGPVPDRHSVLGAGAVGTDQVDRDHGQREDGQMSGLEIFAVAVIAWWTIQIIVPGI